MSKLKIIQNLHFCYTLPNSLQLLLSIVYIILLLKVLGLEFCE